MKALLLSFIIYYLCFSDVKVGGANGTLLTDARLFLFQYTLCARDNRSLFLLL